MDLTPEFWDIVLTYARANDVGEDKLRKLRSAQILRSLASKSAFTTAAVELARNVHAVSDLVRQHRRDFVQPGVCSEAEKDRIEEEVGLIVRSCTQNIERLKNSIPDLQEVAAGRTGINAETAAHRHGVALSLSERLQVISTVFDRYRAVRYEQLLQKQKRHKPALDVQQASYNAQTPQWHQSSISQSTEHGPAQAQQFADAENAALQQELLSMSADVLQAERTMRDIATLNQMFSTQVMHQAEQIEILYKQAVQATGYLDRGNKSLGRAIEYNRAARIYVLVIMLVASGSLLMFDYWYAGRRWR